MTKFFERLDFLIKEKGVNKYTLAKELHIGKSCYSNWSCTDRLPQGKTLVALADYFDVSIDYLVGRKETRD